VKEKTPENFSSEVKKVFVNNTEYDWANQTAKNFEINDTLITHSGTRTYDSAGNPTDSDNDE